jgi:hypothetical protein
MPDFNEMGPSSTPRLFVERQHDQIRQHYSDQDEKVRGQFDAQEIDYETASREILRLQRAYAAEEEQNISTLSTLDQAQNMIDLGFLSPEDGAKAMWSSVLPEEMVKAMYPKPKTEPSRAPLSTGAMENIMESVEDFAEDAPKTTLKKRYGAWGVDVFKRDVRGRSQKDLLSQYNSWRTNIGYDDLTSVQQRQVDSQWDDWVGSQKGNWKWNPESKEVMASRGKGPLTRSYGRQFNKTPIGPGEGGSMLKGSVMASMPKKEEAMPSKQLTEDDVRSIMQEAGGDPIKARKLAQERGYGL